MIVRYGSVVILEVGKRSSKVTLWSRRKGVVERFTRRNEPQRSPLGYPCLDVAGIEAWLAVCLARCARAAPVSAIIPVAHGAAACVLENGALSLAPPDYETDLPDAVRDRYRARRPSFQQTGSPCLPAGLNLGAQLHRLSALAPRLMRRGTIITWPQYWAWRLCGVAATEVSSLGCHTDLWLPYEKRPSKLAVDRGWAGRLAPLRKAGDVLGTVSREWQDRCSLPADCAVLCGLHDSAAALLAMRGSAGMGTKDQVMLSTGTWFVAMRAAADGRIISLPANRDCLINLDVAGRPIPSARFMGGREAEFLEQAAEHAINPAAASRALFAAARQGIENGVYALPNFRPGTGPFPHMTGYWINRPNYQLGRRAAVSLYLALMADVSLDLIGARGRLVVSGPYAEDGVFIRALAGLRPKQRVYGLKGFSLCQGAVGLCDPHGPVMLPELVTALPFSIAQYAAQWHRLSDSVSLAA